MAPKRDYTTEQMSKALADVKKGIPAAVAAKKHGVPRSTLRHKRDGKSPLVCPMGPSTILTKEEEFTLVDWIIKLSERHFPVSKEQLLDTVQKITNSTTRAKTFMKNRPSDKWFRLFLNRHPEISQRVSQNLTPSRESVTENQILNWFTEIKEYLESKHLFDITRNPNRIFNADESAFYLSPKEGKVLATKGNKNVYRSAGDEKENVTVLLTANAAGKIAPPMIVLAYERIPAAISQSVPTGWGLGTSENGWMCSSTFYEYMTNIFSPWLIKENIEKPVLFFVDGHVSHLTMHVSNFCAQNGIELIALYPNSTHLLQPMDVSVFRPLKLAFRNEVQKWRMDNYGNKLQKCNFAVVFEKALSHITEETIQNGFKASGLHPFNIKNVHFKKISAKNNTNKIDSESSVTSSVTTKQSVLALKYFENKVGKERINMFEISLNENENDNWNGPIEDKSLFTIWKEWKLYVQANSDKTIGEDIQKGDKDGENMVQSPVHRTPLKHGQSTSLGNSIITINELTPVSDPQPSTSGTYVINNKVTPPSGQSSQFDSQFKVPTPFKKALFWPDPKPQTKKRKLKEKIPSVVTSEAWRQYYQKKENEKKKKIEEKEQRKIARQQKFLLKKNPKNDFSEDDEESEEDWVESGGSSDDVDPFEDHKKQFTEITQGEVNVGAHVLVKFLGGKRRSVSYRYVCIVQDIVDDNDIKVMCMRSTSLDKNVFMTDEKDVSFVDKNCILGLLPTPKLLTNGERIRYEFPSPVDVYEA